LFHFKVIQNYKQTARFAKRFKWNNRLKKIGNFEKILNFASELEFYVMVKSVILSLGIVEAKIGCIS